MQIFFFKSVIYSSSDQFKIINSIGFKCPTVEGLRRKSVGANN